ncbi:G-type lectin S-receptor-like serine/threonine-protein kinase At1g11330 [Prosopis cineraria]|uniref:G-type lectin S-receptor-like serine/threonine-protein kinase At1g11330 n=1 Tax=Prosopis cineraria TaxID=364024 RepID=UPI00240F3E7B|nr:G-type lectin S-receptor-like serine/threonine-protein kinase At1g11330 [Prosopis cineraria]
MTWQSFQYPCDTLLQDIKLSTNQQTGEKVKFTSWKSTSDPSYGRFSLGLEHHNVTQLFIWKENSPHWRSCPWNGTNFIGVPGRSSTIGKCLQMKEDEGIFEISFYFIDKFLLTTYPLDSQGKLSDHTLDFQKNARELRWRIGDSECDFYGQCGPFGICNSQTVAGTDESRVSSATAKILPTLLPVRLPLFFLIVGVLVGVLQIFSSSSFTVAELHLLLPLFAAVNVIQLESS